MAETHERKGFEVSAGMAVVGILLAATIICLMSALPYMAAHNMLPKTFFGIAFPEDPRTH